MVEKTQRSIRPIIGITFTIYGIVAYILAFNCSIFNPENFEPLAQLVTAVLFSVTGGFVFICAILILQYCHNL